MDIGSGPVESACRHVVGKRLKGGGMRWRTGNAEVMLRLRALTHRIRRQKPLGRRFRPGLADFAIEPTASLDYAKPRIDRFMVVLPCLI